MGQTTRRRATRLLRSQDARSCGRSSRRPNDSFRNYLTGPLGARLFELLEDDAKKKRDVYAALYELDDQQLDAALEKLGKKRPRRSRPTAASRRRVRTRTATARERLAGQDRSPRPDDLPRALAHNKFLVVCDDDDKPRWVWTGSQNWTKTGLCTQANNSVLIDDPGLAAEYREQWDLLEDAGGRDRRTT